MAISTPKLALLTLVLVGSIGLAAFALFSSAIPQFSVYELFVSQNPDDFKGKKIQLVGDVSAVNETTFAIADWESGNHSVIVKYDQVPIPAGFALGKRVLIEGTLDRDLADGWVIQATLISTKCPSKYQS